jgi:cell division protein FtsQ
MATLRDRVTPRTKSLALVALPVVLLVAFAVASYTPMFHARAVRIEGATTIPRDQVLRLAGIEPGTNVFHLDTGAAERSLTTDPWIASAVVERDLPGTVVIRIQERTPVARSSTGSTSVAVAGDGVVLPGAPTNGLPEIRASVGELTDDVRTGAAGALAALEPILRARVSAVVADPSGALVLDLAGDLTVRYGTAGDDAAKATALRAVLGWAAEQHVAVRDVDVTVPQAPSATLVDGSTVTP